MADDVGAAGSGGARRCRRRSGISASICCVGKGPVAEFVAGIDDLDADAGGVDVGDAAPEGAAGVPGALLLGDHAQHLRRPRRPDNGRRPSPPDRAAGRSPRRRPPCRYNGGRASRPAASRSSKLGEGASMISSIGPYRAKSAASRRSNSACDVETAAVQAARATCGSAARRRRARRGRGSRDRRRSASVWPITVSPAPSISAPSGAAASARRAKASRRISGEK